jgi:glycosyltransferase involved in cell wall biosynthesis
MRTDRHSVVWATAKGVVLKVGFHSPMPPAPTGVADYAAALYAELRKLGDVELNVAPADIHLYHAGNNHLHRDIYARALRNPGVVVLHDAVLQHFFLGSLTEQHYIDEFIYNYGEWHADLARSLWNARARSATDPRYFEYPMLKRVAERSRAIIVHNPAAAEMVKAHAPAAAIHEIPHLFVEPTLPPAYEIERLRGSLGLSGSTFLFGVFGHLRESKRLRAILRAFDVVRHSADAALLVAGEFASTDLERSLQPLLHGPGILRVGYLPDADFWLYAAAVDACINLRYPPAGETSGIAIRFMGIGKPVFVSDGLEVSRFPESACIRIDTGPNEEAVLAAAMCWLANAPSDARAIGARAREYVRKNHAVDKVAAAYWSILVDNGLHDSRPTQNHGVHRSSGS